MSYNGERDATPTCLPSDSNLITKCHSIFSPWSTVSRSNPSLIQTGSTHPSHDQIPVVLVRRKKRKKRHNIHLWVDMQDHNPYAGCFPKASD